MVSKHYNRQRYKRERLIDKYVHGDGNVIDSFIVDRGHKHGDEIHLVTDTGLIIIKNRTTNKLITKLIARPRQIKKLYENVGKSPPKQILELAEWHQSLGYNRS